MKLIVGLGNPGKKYEHTRHNAGFLALDYYLREVQTISCTSRFSGYVCEAHFTANKHPKGPIKVFFVKPNSFMNHSGKPIKEITQYYKVDPETELLVLHDELDLKFGFWKPAFDSRAAGHNGIKSILDELGTQKFSRIRIGIESRKSRFEHATEDYVLSEFNPDELSVLEQKVFPEIAEAVTDFIYK